MSRARRARSARPTCGSSTPRRERRACPKIVMHDQARWFAFHELRATGRALHDPATCSSSALPTPFGFGLWTSHFTPDDPRRAVHRLRALRRRAGAGRDRAVPRHRARRGLDPIRDAVELARDRAVRPLVAARDVHRRRDGALRARPRVRGAHGRDRAAVLRQQRDRRALGHHARRSPRAAACAPRAASSPRCTSASSIPRPTPT